VRGTVGTRREVGGEGMRGSGGRRGKGGQTDKKSSGRGNRTKGQGGRKEERKQEMKEVREERRREGEGRRVYGGRGEEGASPPDRGLLGPPVYLHLKTPNKTLPQVVGEGKGGKEGRREEDRQQRLR